jgi:hypothetical protein
MGYYTWKDISMCQAPKDQLTAWRNADVKLATAECLAIDKFLSGFITLPHYSTTRRGTGNFVKTRDTEGRRLGRYTGVHRLQTAVFCYWMMQGCTTSENDPGAGFHKHTIALGTTEVPINVGLHVQHEHATDNLRWDLLGLCPGSLTVSCSETDQIARQRVNIPFAYANVSGDDITKTDLSLGTKGTVQKRWEHAVTGGLGPSQTAFTYNNVAVECDIIGVRVNMMRSTEFHARDANSYPTIGELFNFDFNVELDVIPDGKDIWEIMELEKDSYAAGNLDLDFKFQYDSDEDYIQFAASDMWLVPIDKEYSYNKGTDSYTIVIEPMSDASTLEVTSQDSLSNDYYET